MRRMCAAGALHLRERCTFTDSLWTDRRQGQTVRALLPDRTINVAVGRAIRDLRQRQDLTQEEYAFRCGLHPTYVSSIERGNRNTSLAALYRLAIGLDIPMSELFAEAERHLGDGPARG